MRSIISSPRNQGNVDNCKNIAFANHVLKWNSFVA